MLSADLSFKDGQGNGHCGFVLLGLLQPQLDPIEQARRQGLAVCQLLRRQVPGLIPISPKGSKASRAHAVAPLVEAGQVRFHRRSDGLIEELLVFSR